MTLPLVGLDPEKPLRLRLVFNEPQPRQPGERVFRVAVGDRDLLGELDIVVATGGPMRALVREVAGPLAIDRPASSPAVLKLAFTPIRGEPLICGVEIVQGQP